MKRLIAMALSIIMVFSVMSGALSVAFAAGSGNEWETLDAMHFMVRQWHSVSDPKLGLPSSGPSNAVNRSEYSVLIDGYIVPDAENNTFRFFISRNSKIDPMPMQEVSEADLSSFVYITGLDSDNGIVTISTNAYVDTDGSGITLESLAGFSISAGHDAVKGDNAAETLTIWYRPDVHLVKAHAFYIATGMIVEGAGEDTRTLPDGTEITVDFEKEKDTYTDSKSGIKFYNTAQGLHTDKTASESKKDPGDGRTFDIDLEAWYANDFTANVALILDASGSMAFTSSEPEQINVETVLADLGDEIDETTKAKILAKKLIKGVNEPLADSDWGNIFLTQAEVDLILNPHNTDHSRLSSSGYTYFVYDKRSTTLEYAPLAYWDGTSATEGSAVIGYYEFNKGPAATDVSTDRNWLYNKARGTWAEVVEQVTAGDAFTKIEEGKHSWPRANSINGFSTTSSNWNIGNQASVGGMLLEAAATPASKNFTIQFTINKTGSGDASITDDQKAAEILYIGSLKGGTEGEDYLRFVRDAGSGRGRFRAYQNDDTNNLINLNVFSTTSPVTVTLVFENGYLTAYSTYNDEQSTPVQVSLPDDFRIIFAGISDDYNGADLTFDNLYIFNKALTPAKVTAEISKFNNAPTSGTPVITTAKGDVMGTIPAGYIRADRESRAGWYYINPTSAWDSNYINNDIQTAKTFHGTRTQIGSTGSNPLYYYYRREIDDDKSADLTYAPGTDAYTPTQFFIDENGNLCCFFATGTNQGNTGCSYVYEYADEDYIKTESLQRALGAFVTSLHESSPNSYVSAVRFSTRRLSATYLEDLGENSTTAQQKEKDNLKKLILLDWTKDTGEILSILSLQRGDGENKGGTVDGTESATHPSDRKTLWQYNYGLTGDTSTFTGLKAFRDNLLYGQNTDPKGPGVADMTNKYLIVLTDGLDTDVRDNTKDNGKALAIGNELKNDYGYKIITIMLAGGPVREGSDEYRRAESFLSDLASKDANNKTYFYSTTTEGLTGTLAVDALTRIFSQEVIQLLSLHLDGYTVQDYIDPRFDLIDADGRTWYLNADGNVKVVNADGSDYASYRLSKSQSATIVVTSDADVDETTAKLFYNADSDKKLYYLVWENQTIPGISTNAEKLSVWNTRITIRAKEDFIGGNAVLTNGNLANMNYVYHPSDKGAKSSGTDDDNPFWVNGDFDKDDYPSKGFPRVVVNVQMPAPDGVGRELLYMGEPLDPLSTLKKMIDAVVNNTEGLWTYTKHPYARWYWEYLARYDAMYPDEHVFDTLIAEHTISLPYYYLPNMDHTNQTGTAKHIADVLGVMTYTWVTTPDSGISYNPTTDKIARTVTMSVQYTPYPISETNGKAASTDDEIYYRENLLNDPESGLISEYRRNDDGELELVYKWDRDYKKEVGTSSPHKGTYTFLSELVSGEIAMQMLLTRQNIADLKRWYPEGITLTYQAELKRTYGSIKNETVGTYTVEFQIPDDIPSGSGNVIVKGVVRYDDAYDYSAAYGLPIGTYTLTPISDPYEKFTISDLEVIPLNNTAHAGRFLQYGKQYGETGSNLATFEAITRGVQPLYLGTDMLSGKTYTDQRYALLQVRIFEDDPQVPQTGDDSHIGLWLAMLVLSMTALSTCIFLGKKKKNR